jgi:hypothetical protein
MVLENKLLMRILKPKEFNNSGAGVGENYIMRSFIICHLHLILL